MDVLRRGQVITNTISSLVVQGLAHEIYVLDDKKNNLIVLVVGLDAERTEARAPLVSEDMWQW
jgi:hypothetical protein